MALESASTQELLERMSDANAAIQRASLANEDRIKVWRTQMLPIQSELERRYPPNTEPLP